MGKRGVSRPVQCYPCRHRFEVGWSTQSTSCPKCSRAVMVSDVIVKELKPVNEVKTCGKVVVHRKGRVIAKVVEAHGGVEMLGILTANVISGGPVVIGAKAQWKGNCKAPSVTVRPGARVDGYFDVPDFSVGVGEEARQADEAQAPDTAQAAVASAH